VRLEIELLAYPIGPAGDTLYLPFRIVRGAFTGFAAEQLVLGGEKLVLGGNDFAAMQADEPLRHNGRFLVGDPAGDIVFTYEGTSDAPEGAYERILDGRMPGSMRSTLVVRATSHNDRWRPHQRRPLIGLGNLDARRGLLDFTLLSLP
jgi:hypothetical protein